MAKDEEERLDVAIGRRLSILRETSGLTRTELASKSGYPLSDIIAHEDGSLRLSASRMFKLCTLLGAKPADLLQGLQQDGRGGRSLHDGGESFDA